MPYPDRSTYQVWPSLVSLCKSQHYSNFALFLCRTQQEVRLRYTGSGGASEVLPSNVTSLQSDDLHRQSPFQPHPPATRSNSKPKNSLQQLQSNTSIPAPTHLLLHTRCSYCGRQVFSSLNNANTHSGECLLLINLRFGALGFVTAY